MLFFGHLGIGEFISRPFSYSKKDLKRLPVRAILLGTVLPDLVDKTLYYVPSLVTGKHGAELGLISSTRSFGHCAFIILLISFLAMRLKRPFFEALALGMATHIPLDVVADFLRHRDVSYPDADPIYAYLFPFLGFKFPVLPYESMGAHAMKLLDFTIISSELLGLALLAFKFKKQLKRFFTGSVGATLIGFILMGGVLQACGTGLDTPVGLINKDSSDLFSRITREEIVGWDNAGKIVNPFSKLKTLIFPGQIILFKTVNGNYGKLRIAEYGAGGGPGFEDLNGKFVIFAGNGTSGAITNFTVTSTYTFGFDLNTETCAGSCDIKWDNNPPLSLVSQGTAKLGFYP